MANFYAKYDGIFGGGGGGGGTGDVVGPSSATDNAVARFDGTTGKLIQNSVVIVDDSGNVTGVGTLNASGTATVGDLIDSGLTVSQLVATDGSKKLISQATGNLTAAGTDGITIGNGSGAVIGSGSTISQHVADTTHNGYLSSTDWNTFNGKQGSGNYITALTGDVTASGPGSVAATLAATSNATLTTLSGLTTAASLATVGTVTSGTWNATTIAVNHGGTGQVTAAAAFNALSPITTTGDIIYSPSGATSQRLAIGSTGNVLTVAGGVPTWAPPATAGTVTTVSVVTANGFSGSVANPTSTPAITLSYTGVGLVEEFPGMIEAPTAKTYVLDQSAAYAYTINTLIIATVSGTITAAVKINGTNVTGISAVSVSSTPATGTASAANSVAIGDKVTLVLSSASSPVDLSFTLKVTRA